MMDRLTACLYDPQGRRFNGAALLYSVSGHGPDIAAYLVHECSHSPVFRSSRHNRHRAEVRRPRFRRPAMQRELFGGNAASFLTSF